MPEPRFDPTIGDAVRAMEVGEARVVPVPAGRTPRELSIRLGNWAVRAWGAGCHSTETLAGAVRITRHAARRAEPGAAAAAHRRPPTPLAVPVAPGGMGREKAAAWLSRYFPDGMTAERLARLDAKKRGPRRYRAGKAVVYFEADLAEWLRHRFRVVEAPHAA